jgi:hypothetical protein
MELHNKWVDLITLPGNIRLGWTWLEVTNTLAYKLVTAVKSFIVQAPRGTRESERGRDVGKILSAHLHRC